MQMYDLRSHQYFGSNMRQTTKSYLTGAISQQPLRFGWTGWWRLDKTSDTLSPDIQIQKSVTVSNGFFIRTYGCVVWSAHMDNRWKPLIFWTVIISIDSFECDVQPPSTSSAESQWLLSYRPWNMDVEVYFSYMDNSWKLLHFLNLNIKRKSFK